MATTTKTLAPTGQTITLPDMTERPDASVLVTDIGRNTDAINAVDAKTFKGSLANGTDFNNITAAGAYSFLWIQDGTTYHRPVNQGGLLIVSIQDTAGTKAQQYTDTNGKVYARGYHDNAWTDWKELATTDQLPKIKTKVVNATTGSTGAVYTDISQVNYILGYKMNDANTNLEITGTIAYNGAWFLQTTANNTPVSITVMYHET